MADKQYVRGMIAVCTFSTISNLAATGMFLWVTIKKSGNRMVSRQVMNLLFADWLQSIGFLLSYKWIADGKISPGAYCNLQGTIINLGDTSSGFWATAICIHTYMLVVHSYEPKWYLQICMAVIWPLNIFIALIGYVIQKPNQPFFGSAGGAWCWISPKYDVYRIALHYGIILILALMMITFYTTMFVYVYRRAAPRMESTQRTLKKTGKKLIWYPGAYILLVAPLGIGRFLSVFGVQLPFTFLIIAGCVFTSSGLVNSIIYGFTRNLASAKPMFEMVPNLQRRLTRLSANPGRFSRMFSQTNSSEPLNFTISVSTVTEKRLSTVSNLPSPTNTSYHGVSSYAERNSFLAPPSPMEPVFHDRDY